LCRVGLKSEAAAHSTRWASNWSSSENGPNEHSPRTEAAAEEHASNLLRPHGIGNRHFLRTLERILDQGPWQLLAQVPLFGFSCRAYVRHRSSCHGDRATAACRMPSPVRCRRVDRNEALLSVTCSGAMDGHSITGDRRAVHAQLPSSTAHVRASFQCGGRKYRNTAGKNLISVIFFSIGLPKAIGPSKITKFS
jgi:hypothetical protein